MQVLRLSVFMDAYDSPLTTVVRDCDVRDDLDQVRQQMRKPGYLLVDDLFEMDAERTIASASLEALDRARDRHEEEAHMAMLYYCTAAQFKRLKRGGTIAMDRPAPLDEDIMRLVFEQLAQHPDYQEFTIIAFSKNGTPVGLP